MSADTVVPNISALDEDDFHAAMMEAIASMIGKHGRAKVALALGVSVRQLANLALGSFPAPWRLWNLLTLDPGALDKIDRRYNRRSVTRDAVCSTDPVSAKLAHLLSRTIEIERPDSDGGTHVNLRELMMLDEDELRFCARTLCGWVEQLDAYRSCEKPRLRVAK